MSFGRIHCFLVSTKASQVVYERFYDRLSESEKAEVRAAFFQASSAYSDNQTHVAAYKAARFVFMPVADMVFFLLSSGEMDELAAADALATIVNALPEVLGRAPSSSLLLERYARMALVVDEIINEGLLEATDVDVIRKAIKNKATWE
uniref:Coatomer subunit zeta n=1 Tax=Chlamydomonas euryale TaxID=1486919 RepID=A0A7R9V7B1_9CHLO|mmetsp:Transcript_22925/g.68150  ORF Transcript_22925/g.68150 Transcript_22925/m.68150 type:complete len:148 (+) Transcript_22925:63-506(+)|eukprot:366223-Chlamydomonas_euryale.AAC.15